GYKVAAIVMALISLAGIWASVARVRERPHDASKEVSYGLLQAVAQTFKNPAFRPYLFGFGIFRIAFFAVVALLPFQANVVLGLDDPEAATGMLTAMIVVGSALLFPVVEW